MASIDAAGYSEYGKNISYPEIFWNMLLA